jgi:hypothetical protein
MVSLRARALCAPPTTQRKNFFETKKMGNVDSSNAFAGVDELKDTLAGLET